MLVKWKQGVMCLVSPSGVQHDSQAAWQLTCRHVLRAGRERSPSLSASSGAARLTRCSFPRAVAPAWHDAHIDPAVCMIAWSQAGKIYFLTANDEIIQHNLCTPLWYLRDATELPLSATMSASLCCSQAFARQGNSKRMHSGTVASNLPGCARSAASQAPASCP